MAALLDHGLTVVEIDRLALAAPLVESRPAPSASDEVWSHRDVRDLERPVLRPFSPPRRRLSLGELASRGSAVASPAMSRVMPGAGSAGGVPVAAFQSVSR